jgi:hypothetical protein
MLLAGHGVGGPEYACTARIDRVGDHRFATRRWRQNMQRPDLGSRDPA